MKQDIQKWVKTCPQCQLNSTKTRSHQDTMHPLPVPPAFSRWHLDFVGELPETMNGNHWLLTAVDTLTNWPIARALPVASKEAVAQFIYEEIVMRFGCPSEIVTDRGANFTSGLVSEYVKTIGINHKLTSAFHPRSNSKVERYNGVIKQMLRKYVNGAYHRWDDFVNAALWASRIRKHATTGYSPFFLVYGREPQLPGDDLQPFISRTTLADQRTIDDITSRELAALGQHRAAAEFKLKAVSEQDKARWDAAIKPLSIEVGDMVMITHEGKLGLEPRFKGPYIVTEFFEEFGTCRLETVEGEPLQSLVHLDRIKRAEGEKPTQAWYDPTVERRAVRSAIRRFTNQDELEGPKPDYVDPVQSSVSKSATSISPLAPAGNCFTPPIIVPRVSIPNDTNKALNDYSDTVINDIIMEHTQNNDKEEPTVDQASVEMEDDFRSVVSNFSEPHSLPLEESQFMDVNSPINDYVSEASISTSAYTPKSVPSPILSSTQLPPIAVTPTRSNTPDPVRTPVEMKTTVNQNNNADQQEMDECDHTPDIEHDDNFFSDIEAGDPAVDSILTAMIADSDDNSSIIDEVIPTSEIVPPLTNQSTIPQPLLEHSIASQQFITENNSYGRQSPPSPQVDIDVLSVHSSSRPSSPRHDTEIVEAPTAGSPRENTTIIDRSLQDVFIPIPRPPLRFTVPRHIQKAIVESNKFRAVQRRTFVQEGGDVRHENNYVEEMDIPEFIESWNKNKKRKFKPKLGISKKRKSQ